MIGYIFPEIVTSFKGLNSKCMAAFEPIERFEDIDFDTLPEKFVLKTTHDSGGVVML